ncbi:hypothetical protein ACFX5D_14030 [Flavobacterium sp. LB3P45]|uniref:Lipoprotein n=1 Tax=Flavobacterium fructosi TaxID=3230416 RepID=A0ABW6HPZ6_9FLAO
MKNLKHIVLLFFSLMVLASCGSSKPAMTESKTQIITKLETVHDTVFRIEKDSSSYQALLECQNGKVVIKSIVQSEPGSILKIPKVRLADNLLKVDCEARAQELFARWKDTYESNYIKEIPPPVEVNKLTDWQKAQINIFRIYAVLTLLFGAWVFIKSKL